MAPWYSAPVIGLMNGSPRGSMERAIAVSWQGVELAGTTVSAIAICKFAAVYRPFGVGHGRLPAKNAIRKSMQAGTSVLRLACVAKPDHGLGARRARKSGTVRTAD